MYAAPSQITPGEQFDISYFIRNHTDAGTYYVRARMYDVRTGTLLGTYNLEQSSANSRLFKKTIEAPADPSSYGRSIVVVATVYTDSGYSTRSDNYEEQEQAFLVKASSSLLGGAIDLTPFAERIEEAVRQEIAKIRMPDIPAPAEFPKDSLFGTLGWIIKEVNRIKKRDEQEPDRTPLVLRRFAAVEQQIAALPKPPQIGPLVEQLRALVRRIESLEGTVRKTGAGVVDIVMDEIKGISEKVLETVGRSAQEHMSKQELTVPLEKLFKLPEGARQEKEDPTRSIQSLM